MDDLELADRLADRDPRAMDLLVDRHHASVYRFLRQLSRRVEDAEDLAQQTLLRAVAGAGRYDGRAPFRSWLLGIAFREYTKLRRRRPWVSLSSEHGSKDFSAQLVQGEVLLDAIGRLSPNTRAVFLMHHVEELSVLEIAAALGVPEGTVKSRLHASRAKLRVLLEPEAKYVPESC